MVSIAKAKCFDRADFDEWMRNPITIEIIKSFRIRKEIIIDRLNNDNSFLRQDYNHYHKLANTAFYKGMASAYGEVSQIGWADFNPPEEKGDA